MAKERMGDLELQGRPPHAWPVQKDKLRASITAKFSQANSPQHSLQPIIPKACEV